MYYYILEAPTSRAAHRALDKTRTTITSLGIAGEFVTTTPTRSIEELAELGVTKKYSTIVAIGSEEFVNRLAMLLAGTPYVFGAILLENQASFATINGANSIEEAAEALKYRRIKKVSVCRIEPNKYFLTRAKIDFGQTLAVRLTVNQAVIETACSDIAFSGSGIITIENRFTSNDPMKRAWNWLIGKELEKFNNSQFQGKKFSLEVNGTYPVYVGKEVLAKTPLAAEVIPRCLKIICKRDKITTNALSNHQLSNTSNGRLQYSKINW